VENFLIVAVSATDEVHRTRRLTVEGRVALMVPLVDQLQPFCCGHEAADGGAAAGAMLGHVRRLWPDIPQVDVAADPADDRDAEELALSVVRDVGDVAGILLSARNLEKELAWTRANLIHDLECYARLVTHPS
jgi:hypothetical protein